MFPPALHDRPHWCRQQSRVPFVSRPRSHPWPHSARSPRVLARTFAAMQSKSGTRCVLGSATEGKDFAAEFDYELDVDNQPLTVTRFALAPDQFFLTDDRDNLDYTVVALGQRLAGNRDLASYGGLPLSSARNKHALGDFVNIVQHPDGRLKEAVGPGERAGRPPERCRDSPALRHGHGAGVLGLARVQRALGGRCPASLGRAAPRFHRRQGGARAPDRQRRRSDQRHRHRLEHEEVQARSALAAAAR